LIALCANNKARNERSAFGPVGQSAAHWEERSCGLTRLLWPRVIVSVARHSVVLSRRSLRWPFRYAEELAKLGDGYGVMQVGHPPALSPSAPCGQRSLTPCRAGYHAVGYHAVRDTMPWDTMPWRDTMPCGIPCRGIPCRGGIPCRAGHHAVGYHAVEGYHAVGYHAVRDTAPLDTMVH
jgi:hypothetical protein